MTESKGMCPNADEMCCLPDTKSPEEIGTFYCYKWEILSEVLETSTRSFLKKHLTLTPMTTLCRNTLENPHVNLLENLPKWSFLKTLMQYCNTNYDAGTWAATWSFLKHDLFKVCLKAPMLNSLKPHEEFYVIYIIRIRKLDISPDAACVQILLIKGNLIKRILMYHLDFSKRRKTVQPYAADCSPERLIHVKKSFRVY